MPDLYSVSFLNGKRTEGDTPADAFIPAAFSEPAAKFGLQQWMADTSANRQLLSLPAAYTNESLFAHVGQLPDWADEQQMQAGAAFFARHAQPIMNLLGLLSLPYCYAGADGAMVLYLSERIRNNTGKRLAETAAFVWEVMAPSAFTPQGNGFAACLKIRLTHAAARYYTLQSKRWNSDWGYPINQEDMAGTHLSFSLMVIRGLRKMGYVITAQDQAAYLHLWNVISHLLGLNETLLPADGLQANLLEEAIRLHQFRPSEQGQQLTASLISYFNSANTSRFLLADDIVQLMRYLLDDEVAGYLNIKASSLSPSKLQLLKTVALLNEFRPPSSTWQLYNNEHQKFKKQMNSIS